MDHESLVFPELAPNNRYRSRGYRRGVSVARDGGAGRAQNFDHHKELLGHVPGTLNDPETEIELIPRIAASHSQGILHTAHEKGATLILMGWRGKRSLREQVLGSVLDEGIWGSGTPVMIGRVNLPLNCTQNDTITRYLLQ
ncbi:MAG: hypothetical protein FJZ87_12425 [Chloroflexi bacterium]|nr:hypothetical protein [Chloroflexota bacterium]